MENLPLLETFHTNFLTKQFRQVEYGKFNRDDNKERGDNRDRPNDQERGSGGGFNRDRPNDRDRNSGGGGFNRDRPNDRDRSSGGGFNRERSNDRDRSSGGGGGFNRGGGGDRGGGFNRGGGNDRGGGGGFNRGGSGDRGGGFNRDNREGREEEESVFSKRVRAGKRRTYFFDVKKTKGEDYFITITESTRREDGFGYKRHKLFLYKEDFNRFAASLNEVVEHVKKDLMPDFDYEEFDRRQAEWEAQNRDSEDGEERSTGGFERNEAGDDEDENEVKPKNQAAEKEKEKEKDEDDVEW